MIVQMNWNVLDELCANGGKWRFETGSLECEIAYLVCKRISPEICEAVDRGYQRLNARPVLNKEWIVKFGSIYEYLCEKSFCSAFFEGLNSIKANEPYDNENVAYLHDILREELEAQEKAE